jgi:hypothetical protein
VAISLVYAGLAALWIAASDHLLGMAINDATLLVQIDSVKGFAFVAVTATLLYLLLANRQGPDFRDIQPPRTCSRG